MSKRIALFAGVALVIAGTVAAPSSVVLEAQHASRGVNVVVTASRISLTAQDAPLADVLTAIGREAGITVVLKGDVTSSVTETVVNAPLDEVVRRLTRGHSVVIVYDRAPDRPDAVVLTEVRVTGAATGRLIVASEGPASGYSSGSAADLARHALAQSRRLELTTALRQVAPGNATRIVETLMERGAPVVKTLRTTAMTDPDPDVRRGAIRVLASLKGHDAVEAIRTTIGDTDPKVRSEAITALRRLDAKPARKHRQ